jgi:hypothetical protein
VPELNGSQFAPVATQNDTTVTIIPSVVTQGRDNGFPYSITLRQGQTYQLRNLSGWPNDLPGTLVSADKPIGLFGSHACANVASSRFGFCDCLVEQLLPVQRRGTDYLTFPLKGRSKGDLIRVLAAFDLTHISINGVAVATLDRGEFYQTVLAAAARITADRPVHVTQYATSSDHDLVVNADPFMLQVPHRALFSSVQRFSTPLAGFASHHINVIAPAPIAGQVLLDGVAIPAGLFVPIGASGFSGASVSVAAGVHAVTAPQPVGVTVYGWSEYESYGWAACYAFGDTTPPILQCPEPITLQISNATLAAPVCTVPVPDLRSQVVVSDNCPRSASGLTAPAFTVSQEPAPGTQVGPGEHLVVLRATDASGNLGTCVTRLTVIAPPPPAGAVPVVSCPSDRRVLCTSSAGAVVEFDAYATVGCVQIPMECNPPSGSLFPVGTTVVRCTSKGLAPEVSCSFSVTVTCTALNASLRDGKVSVTWPADEQLQMAEQITGPWIDLPRSSPLLQSETGTLQLQPSVSGQRFYRIRLRSQ